MFKFVDIIGTDEESKTVLATYRNGSLVLDAIPAAVNYMKSKTGYTMLLKDYSGVVFEVTPDSTLESAEESWMIAKQMNNKVPAGLFEQPAPSQPSMQ